MKKMYKFIIVTLLMVPASTFKCFAKTDTTTIINFDRKDYTVGGIKLSLSWHYCKEAKGFIVQAATINGTSPINCNKLIVHPGEYGNFERTLKITISKYAQLSTDFNEQNYLFTSDEFFEAISDFYETINTAANAVKPAQKSNHSKKKIDEKEIVNETEELEEDEYPDSLKIAKSSRQFLGALYANYSGIQDDDPSGFSQYYGRLNQPLNQSKGIDSDATCRQRIIPFRNFMFQLTYANAQKLPVYPDTVTVDQSERYVNRMDLLERAFLNANLTVNILTYVLPSSQNHIGDLAHLYFSFKTSLLATSIIDTHAVNYPKNYTVYSNLYGLNLGFRTENVPYTTVPIRIEVNCDLFYVYAATSSVNSDLNFQYNNSRDFSQLQNANKKLTVPIQPFLHFDALLMYNTSSNEDNGSNIFIHYSYFENLKALGSGYFKNNYMQFQIGYALDIGKLFPKKQS